MRNIYLLAIANLAVLCTFGQIRRVATNSSNIASQIPGFSEVSTINTKTISYSPSTPASIPTPTDGDTTSEISKEYEYADVLSVSISTSDGNVTSTTVGKVWTLRISVPNALNVRLIFDQLSLSSSAEMYIFNEDKTILDSAIKQADFSYTTEVANYAMSTNSLIVYVVEPGNFSSLVSQISILKLEAGYQSIQDVGDQGSSYARNGTKITPMINYFRDYGSSGSGRSVSNGLDGINSFNNNIAMPEPYNNLGGEVSNLSPETCSQTIQDAAEWETYYAPGGTTCIPMIKCFSYHEYESRAVVRIITNGLGGTGTFINNEAFDGAPYVITAFHLIDKNKNGTLDTDEILALNSSSYAVHFWRTECNGSVNGLTNNYSGAQLIAQSHASDMVLLYLRNPPGIGDGVNYMGWNRSNSSPSNSGSYIIHHPDLGDMRHTKTRFVQSYLWNSNYWQAGYSDGVVTKGSSGSALFNENDQIIGQLKGGWSDCSFTDFSDRYGKFGTSWTVAGLQSYLSPVNNYNDITGINLTDIVILGPSEINCSSAQTYSVRAGIAGCTYTWSVSSDLTIISGQGTASITVLGNSAYNTNFYGTVSCTLATPGKGILRSKTIDKTVTWPTSTVVGYYSRAGYTNSYPLQQDADGTNEVYPGTSYVFITSPSTTGATWSVVYGSPTSWSWNASYSQLTIDIPNNEFVTFKMDVSTTCGTVSFLFSFYGYIGASYLMAPNPTSSNLVITVDETKTDNKGLNNSGKHTTVAKGSIQEVRVTDKFGKILKSIKYPKDSKKINVDVSDLKSDIYIIRVFDGKSWVPLKFIKI